MCANLVPPFHLIKNQWLSQKKKKSMVNFFFQTKIVEGVNKEIIILGDKS